MHTNTVHYFCGKKKYFFNGILNLRYNLFL